MRIKNVDEFLSETTPDDDNPDYVAYRPTAQRMAAINKAGRQGRETPEAVAAYYKEDYSVMR